MRLGGFDANGIWRWQKAGNEDIPATDVRVLTSGGQNIPAHSTILASASPVFESMLDGPPKRGGPERIIKIFGVPCEAVIAFVRVLYSARCELGQGEAGEVERHGVHLLVLSHVYRVGWLKLMCEAGLGALLDVEGVVDVLQLALQCDAPRLHLRCLRLMAKDLGAVQKTEAWRFLQDHDPWLELHILQFLEESHLRMKQRRRRKRKEQGVYLQLSEEMECLEHICMEGCTYVGPYDREPPTTREVPCSKFPTCQGLQLLIRHFATCDRKRTSVRCCRCKQMWQLLRLHSSMCDQPDSCKVPLCKQFKLRIQHKVEKEDEERWKLLARKVVLAKGMSTLAKRKRQQQP